jgi:two-component system, LytTR family, sensor kinase
VIQKGHVRPPEDARGVWRVRLTIVGAFTVLGVLFSSQVWVDYAYSGASISWLRALIVALGQWYLWALLTPALLALAQRVRLERPRFGRALAVHLATSVLVAVAVLVLQSAFARFVTGVVRAPFSLLQVHVALLTYWAIIGASYTVAYYNSSRDRAMRAAQLEAQVAEAQLQTLRLQLQPHFLFNTLNAIGALMRENVEAADLMLTRLSDLLRATLDTSDAPQVSLRRELALLEPYLDIQQARIGSRLTLEMDVDPAALDVEVPTLMLQPLVENAIKHGVADRSGPGRVKVSGKVAGGFLEIAVTDDGPGPPPSVSSRGHGLDNVRRRLLALHGDAGVLTLDRGPAGGACAKVRLPIPSTTLQ